MKEILACTPSYIFYSDPHANQWREDYFLQNGLDFILAYFYSPTRYHFRRVPADRILSFPWSIPDDWVSTEPITCRKQSHIALFGASQHEAYDVRNWCRTFPFVESLTNSGVENKVMPDQEYMKWLGTWDAAIAAGSDDPRYRLTTPKYFEIPAAGSLPLCPGNRRSRASWVSAHGELRSLQPHKLCTACPAIPDEAGGSHRYTESGQGVDPTPSPHVDSA